MKKSVKVKEKFLVVFSNFSLQKVYPISFTMIVMFVVVYMLTLYKLLSISQELTNIKL